MNVRLTFFIAATNIARMLGFKLSLHRNHTTKIVDGWECVDKLGPVRWRIERLR